MIFFMKLCGVCFGYFALRLLARQFFITSSIMTKIVSVFFLIQWFAHLFFIHFIALFFLNVILLLFFVSAIFIYRQRRETLFQYSFPEFLTSIILQMKIGKSFRASFQSSSQNLPRYQKEILERIFRNVVFLPQNDDKKLTMERSYNAFLLHELRKIDGSKHQTVEKIINFRSRLITANNFRRRSGRVRENIYVQVGFMAFIYVMAFAYVFMTMKLSDVKDILMVSIILFFVGGIGAFAVGRKIKWTI
jgi:hypothetical protein